MIHMALSRAANLALIVYFVMLGTISLVSAFGESKLSHKLYEKTFTFSQQNVDHFTPEDSRVFSQRYFEILDHFTEPRGPIFLVICGEWACSGVYAPFMLELAQSFGAAVVTLEHRYYGESSPFQELTVENLKYLTSKQALFDLAVFRNYYQDLTNKKYHKEGDNPWFVIGASYPGALSAWFRLKFPHLVRGSLASSAVVEAVFNYSAYDEQVGISVGPDCRSALQEVTALAEKGLAENATAVKSLFNAQELRDDDFLAFIANVAAAPVQFGRVNIICSPLLEAKESGQNLLNAYANYTLATGLDVHYRDPNYLKTRIQAGPHSQSRNWAYQFCTEFGFLQVAPAKNSIRSARINSDYYLNFCAEVFGNGTYPQVDMTNLYYGGRNISGSKILFMNGSQDPWRHASKQSSSVNEPSFIVTCDTCGHSVDLRGCSVAYGNVTQCKEEVAKAHAIITSFAKECLSL